MRKKKKKGVVSNPQRHLAVFSQQGHIKDETVQKLLQHRGTEVPVTVE